MLKRSRRTAAVRRLTLSQCRQRAAQTRLVITDCDGVLTDAGIYVSSTGAVMRRFSVRDGMGVARLRAAGIDTALVSQERTRDIGARAAKLRLRHVFLGSGDKRTALAEICRSTGYTLGQLAYIGDDVNDLEVMTQVGTAGLTAAPADAMPEIAAAATWQSQHDGGYGAFREFAEWILSLRAAGKGQGS